MNVDKTTTVMPAKAGIRKRVCASHDSCAADAARPDPRLRGGDGLFVYVQCETALVGVSMPSILSVLCTRIWIPDGDAQGLRQAVGAQLTNEDALILQGQANLLGRGAEFNQQKIGHAGIDLQPKPRQFFRQ